MNCPRNGPEDRSDMESSLKGINCDDKTKPKHFAKTTYKLMMGCHLIPVFLILFALGMNQTAIQVVNLYNF